MTTIKDLLTEARTRLSGPDAAAEAEWLLEAVCGISRARLFSHPDEVIADNRVERFHEALARRLSGEPLAYIIGYRDFWDMRLKVTPDVLIPQPDTEILVEQALARIPARAQWWIADLGTGTGAVALAIARERPSCTILAIDVSAPSLAVAKVNIAEYGTGNVRIVQADWLRSFADSSLDMIVGNPPYIADDDACLKEGDVSREPRMALAAGDEGMDELLSIASQAERCLQPGGWLILEHGSGQASAVAEQMRMERYMELFTARDYSNNERVSGGRRPR